MTHQVHRQIDQKGHSTILCFGMQRVHVFENETNHWSSIAYSFDEHSATQAMPTQQLAENANPMANISDLQAEFMDES